jgi:hypothetical protein
MDVWKANFLRDIYKSQLLENNTLKKTYGPKNDKFYQWLRMLHKEKLRDLYISTNIFRLRN